MGEKIFDFGEHLREIRKSHNLSQKQLANLIGISASSISKFENNTQSPTHEKLKSLAKVFGITVDYLIGYSNKEVIVIDDFSENSKCLIKEIISSISKYDK